MQLKHILFAASVNPNGSNCPIALKLVACVLLMEITTFLRETYRNLPRANKTVGSRFLEPRVSQMWSIAGSSDARPPPTRASNMASTEHGQSLLSATGGGGGSSISNTTTGRRWSAVVNSVATQNSTAAASGTSSTTLGIVGQQSSTTSAHPQSAIIGSPSDSSIAPVSTTTVTSGTVNAGEGRRISFVIQDDVESITSSQTTLAVQVVSYYI